MKGIRRFLTDEGATAAIEYAFLASLIAVACIFVIGHIGRHLRPHFTRIGRALS